jgi:membrane protein implicated in regulation of membrane protease activity
MNPLSRLLAGLVAVLAVIGAFFFGFFILVLALGLGALAWLILSVRMWWLRRQMAARSPGSGRRVPGGPENTAGRQGDVIDADYEVVSRREDD